MTGSVKKTMARSGQLSSKGASMVDSVAGN